MSDTRFRIEVYYTDDEEKELAEELLDSIDSDTTVEYDGMFEGSAEIGDVDALKHSNLHVEFPEGIPIVQAGLAADADTAEFPKSSFSDASELQALRMFCARSKLVDLDDAFRDVLLGTQYLGIPSELIRRTTERSESIPLIDGIDTDGLDAPPRNLPSEDELLPEDVYRLRLTNSMGPVHRKRLEINQIEVFRQVQPDLYDVLLTREEVKAVSELPFVRGIKRYSLADTVTPQMLETVAATNQDGSPPETVVFDLMLHRDDDLEEMKSLVESTIGTGVTDTTPSLIRFEVPSDSPFLAVLANLPHVRRISPYEPPELMCEFVRSVIGIDSINGNPANNPGGWNGKDETVAVIDSGIDDSHPDLAGFTKINFGAGLPHDEFGHGSHVTGIVAGNGAASDGRIRGVAPAANIVSIGIRKAEGALDLPADWGKLLSKATSNGATIINLSLGKQFKGEYQAEAESVDRFCRENPQTLVVVAAGNEGEARDEGRHKPKTLGMPASAKNVITVGASASSRSGNLTWGEKKGSTFPLPPASEELVAGDPDLVAAISSRGSTDANQIKPDVVAPGTQTLSVRANDATISAIGAFDEFDGQYGFLTGTSMAAPVVSGAASILRQYLRVVLDTPSPSAALLKGILIGSTDRLPATPGALEPTSIGYPDFEQGFGRINLANVIPSGETATRQLLHFDDVQNVSDDALEARQPIDGPRKSKRRYKFKRSSASEGPIRIVLVWTDLPGHFLQNNLQLSIKTPGGTKIRGNEQHKAFVTAWELAAGIEVFDKFNNVEVVSIDPPDEGVYRITVIAKDTLEPQGYALCVVGDVFETLVRTF